MKKQINPSIKAHLLRSALILLSLLAICAIPFALAQSRSRGTNNRGVANRTATKSQLRTNTRASAFRYASVPSTADRAVHRRHHLRSVKRPRGVAEQRIRRLSRWMPLRPSRRTTLSCPSAKRGRSRKWTYRACYFDCAESVRSGRFVPASDLSRLRRTPLDRRQWASPRVLLRQQLRSCSDWLVGVQSQSFLPPGRTAVSVPGYHDQCQTISQRLERPDQRIANSHRGLADIQGAR